MTNPEKAARNSDALLSNPDAVMQIWLKHNTRDFIQLIVHESKQEIFIVETLLKLFLEDSGIGSETVRSTWSEMKVEENVALVMNHLAKPRQIMSIAWEYSQTQNVVDTKPE